MNSTLKPVLQAGVQPASAGQPSPAKANVAGVNHAAHPQPAQNSLHSNNLVGQNLTHHAPAVPSVSAHAAPSLAPVSANMAQMAQNMSHHGNLSHVGNSVPPASTAVSPSKTATAPLSLVQDKPNGSQPLALTRTLDKKEPDLSAAQANGSVDSPKPGPNVPAALKAPNPESNQEKQDIARTSPSTPKPPEKTSASPSTPQKSEASAPSQTGNTSEPKVATGNEPPQKSPSKPAEPKCTPTADVAPTQTDTKPAPESANDSPQESAKTPLEPAPSEAKPEPAKVEQKKEEAKTEAALPEPNLDTPKEACEPPKGEDQIDKPEKAEKPQEAQKTVKTLGEMKGSPKPTLKLATVTPPARKRRQSPSKEAPPAKRETITPSHKSKRNRTQVQLYQSPTPELAMATKLSASAGRSTPTKHNDDKLIVFYKNEYLAVRNAEGGFYVCQTMQNVYRTTRKIKIRWLSQDKEDSSGETYRPDFYDITDMECVLTTLSMGRAASGGGQLLSDAERARASSILHRALQAESGETMDVTEEHPDGLDLSLYKDESQLEKKSRKRKSSKSPRSKQRSSDKVSEAVGAKRARSTPKRSPPTRRALTQTQTPTQKPQVNNKRKSQPGSTGSTPTVATSKTATAMSEISTKAKTTPPKRAVAVREAPTPSPRAKSRRVAAINKPSPIVPTPSTSTGKSTRTPRKPPSKK